MDGLDKHKKPRSHYVTCRMTDEVYEAFTAYCDRYHISLSDALYDFAICLMRQDFGRKVYEKMVDHLGGRGGWKAAHNRAETEIHTLDVDAPIHCSRPGCGAVLDPDRSGEWVLHGELIFHDWHCALKYFERKRTKEREALDG